MRGGFAILFCIHHIVTCDIQGEDKMCSNVTHGYETKVFCDIILKVSIFGLLHPFFSGVIDCREQIILVMCCIQNIKISVTVVHVALFLN